MDGFLNLKKNKKHWVEYRKKIIFASENQRDGFKINIVSLARCVLLIFEQVMPRWRNWQTGTYYLSAGGEIGIHATLRG